MGSGTSCFRNQLKAWSAFMVVLIRVVRGEAKAEPEGCTASLWVFFEEVFKALKDEVELSRQVVVAEQV